MPRTETLLDRPDEGDAPSISRDWSDQPAVELRRAVDAEYETAREPQAWADHEKKLFHADADPLRALGSALHEMPHFADDEAVGFPGLRYWLE